MMKSLKDLRESSGLTQTEISKRTGISTSRLRPKEDKGKTVAKFKSSARRKIADQRYDIILNVGDQLSDLNGDPAAELSVKLPNPFYLIQ
jgi:transcriptional regulator with XRE-family HTH domain